MTKRLLLAADRSPRFERAEPWASARGDHCEEGGALWLNEFGSPAFRGIFRSRCERFDARFR
jgi:hypothetical protein